MQSYHAKQTLFNHNNNNEDKGSDDDDDDDDNKSFTLPTKGCKQHFFKIFFHNFSSVKRDETIVISVFLFFFRKN